MIFKRKKYLKELYKALKKEKLIIIYWARQVGKTTLMKMLLKDKDLKEKKIYINFDDIYEKTFKTKRDFISYLEFNYAINFWKKWLLFLDEVQTVDNIEQILKSIYDDDDIKLKIIASWSWLWQIKNLWSSLVWRVKQIWVYPFSFYEFLEYKNIDTNYLKRKKYEEFMFDRIEKLLEEYYTFWGYPAVVLEKTKQLKIEKLSEIIDIYLKKDIAIFLNWKDIISFKKMFSFLANNLSSWLNISEISSFLWTSRDKTEFYLDILERSFLLYKVYPFYSNSRREYSKQATYFLNDLWIVNYFKNNYLFENYNWNIIENFVYLELLKNKNIFSDEIKRYNKVNWSEIDFIYCYKKWWIIPIEVKTNNKDIIPKIFNAFSKDYQKEIDFFIKTTTKTNFKRKITTDKSFDIKIIPFWMISTQID